jgi:propionyl-CoA carboxylase alpha chain
VDGNPVDVDVHSITTDEVDATVRGIRRRFHIGVVDGFVLVDSPLGASTFRASDRLPILDDNSAPEGGLTAPMPGTVTRVLVEVGQVVEAGDALLVLEAMKMEHTIVSACDGAVTALNVAVGDQVERDAVLAEVASA